jgi:hypothetical protein
MAVHLDIVFNTRRMGLPQTVCASGRGAGLPSADVVKKPSNLTVSGTRSREAVKDSADLSFIAVLMSGFTLLADQHCTVFGRKRAVAAHAPVPVSPLFSLLRASGFGMLLSLGCLSAHAFDGTKTPADDPTPMQAFRLGTQAYKAGDLAEASRALEFAAGKGHALAQWKLARMYSEGDGVPHDDLKAFDYYQAIVDAHGEDSPDTPQARFVSNALVALGSYYLTGIPNTRIRPDQRHATEMFQYAATYFGDSDAQYNLGRIYLDGNDSQQRDTVTAARWLRLAADKGQHPAQAVLGHILFAGEDMPRQAARGLMYLTLARDGANGDPDQWIVDLYRDAFAKATQDERDMCLTYLAQFLKDHS